MEAYITLGDTREVGDRINRITLIEVSVKIGEYSADDWEWTKRINDTEYSDEYIKLNVILSLLDNLSYYRDYNKFEDVQDMADFMSEFGYDCARGLKVVESIKEIGMELDSIEADDEYLEEMRELYSDGDPQLVAENKDKILKYITFG